MAERILTGIKPTGQLTLGNYIAVLKNLKQQMDRGECFIFIADLHALTLPIDPEVLRQNSIDLAAFYLAAGLDPKRSALFLQSSVPAHSELNAIMQNYLYMGELSRMTQFKEKSAKMKENAIGLGLFAYPVLMACDIILYDANIVPVGEDQTQHIELARDLVNRFNNRYGNILTMPKAEVRKVGKRIMSLSNPTVKMSKSDPKGDIFLKDDPAVIRKKIMSAVTDLGSEVKFDEENKPGISNLLTIYCALKDISISEAEQIFANYRYGDFKKAVADAVIDELVPFQERYRQIIKDKSYEDVLNEGAKKARAIANQTLKRVQKAIGLLIV
ncbi:MAG: tryptophan--tRNA ligase [Erysipelotrichaceae bacterium]|jgi:tryptophanyl-tRNA synthetase|nr:tryptophan--tRNA ligase [Erysipelotrichaceae bacterium]